ncbi:MAG TPA: hypothetical protein VF188_11985 [Longimicrobiales bacterium]
MSSYRIEGAATLLSSLVHGGEHAGTVSYLRREKIIGPDGAPVDIPVVSGNSLRGLLRDHAATVFHNALGRPELPVQVFHLLWSGGALAKAGAGHVLGARQLADVRRLIPVVSLFGGSGAGKIIEGKLRVGKLVPICAETAHIVPTDLLPEQPRSVWEMLQIEEFTRRDDAKRDQLHHAIEGFTPLAIEASTRGDTLLEVAEHAPAVEDAVDGPAQQMRYGVETLAAGCRLHWWVSLRDVTDVERALFAAAVDSWLADGAAIGGRSATGHGRLRLDVHQWQHQTPTVTVGQALDVTGDPLARHVAEHRAEIIDALGWFA